MMDPLEFDGERDLEGTTVLNWLNTWPPEMSNSEYGRKEKRLNLWDIEKLKSWQVIWKSFVYVLPKKWVSQLQKGESIICKSESKILRIAQTTVI